MSTLSHFTYIKYDNFNTYNEISKLIKYKSKKIIQILILKLNNFLIIFTFINIKYYLLIRSFNLILIS